MQVYVLKLRAIRLFGCNLDTLPIEWAIGYDYPYIFFQSPHVVNSSIGKT